MLRDRERMKGNGIAPPTWEGKRSAAAVPDPEVVDNFMDPIKKNFIRLFVLRLFKGLVAVWKRCLTGFLT